MPRRALLAIALVAALTIIVIVYSRPPTAPSIVILPSAPLTDTPGRIPDRWFPQKWTLMHKIIQSIFGRQRRVLIEAKFILLTNSLDQIIADSGLGPPLVVTNGIDAWIRPDGEPPASKVKTLLLGTQDNVLDRSPDYRSMMYKTRKLNLDFFPRVNSQNTDLSIFLVDSDGVKTNIAFAARTLLPYGQALLLINAASPATITSRTEVIITTASLGTP